MVENTHQYLLEKGIKPSVQRLAIMDYLLCNRCHPTADEIFNSLYPSMPTLSKTTVYNTLKLFVDKGAAISIDIDGKNARFDGYTLPHAHFMCKWCGCIHDFPLEHLSFVDSKYTEELEITDVFIYLKGYCKQCKEELIHTI
ncbi:MAG: transcriptional repressor [Rikenellaceae bacterium]|nr:transcriptional repressor [Rikenellaceae bacterium]